MNQIFKKNHLFKLSKYHKVKKSLFIHEASEDVGGKAYPGSLFTEEQLLAGDGVRPQIAKCNYG